MTVQLCGELNSPAGTHLTRERSNHTSCVDFSRNQPATFNQQCSVKNSAKPLQERIHRASFVMRHWAPIFGGLQVAGVQFGQHVDLATPSTHATCAGFINSIAGAAGRCSRLQRTGAPSRTGTMRAAHSDCAHGAAGLVDHLLADAHRHREFGAEAMVPAFALAHGVRRML